MAGLFFVFSSAIWNQFVDHFFQVICLHLSGHYFYHLLPELGVLSMLSIGGLPDLTVAFLSKTNTEQTTQKTIGSSDIDMRVSHGLPFVDHGAHFVTGKTRAMEIGQFSP